MLTPGDGIVVGVSGGPDSMCLLHILLKLQRELDLHLHVAHLNHSARGTDADDDARHVVRLAEKWGLPVTIERADVPALARRTKLAFEEAARRARYAFLWSTAEALDFRTIAVGHNADDQAETVLMHFLRGAGLAGLRGMLPVTPMCEFRLLPSLCDATCPRRDASSRNARCDLRLIRPLLEIPRVAIEEYCSRENLEPRHDRTNLDTTYFRNRLRHEVLPFLERVSPKLRTRLAHTASVAAADFEALTQLRENVWPEAVREELAGAIVFDRGTWSDLPVSLQRSTLRQAAYRLRQSLRDVSFVHVELARQVALTGQTGARATLPMGLELAVGYDTLTIRDSTCLPPQPEEPRLRGSDEIVVRAPGVTPLPDTDWVLRAGVMERWDLSQIATNSDRWTAYFDMEAIAMPIVLRSRQRGDRFRPMGMGYHSVKLSAFMINRKIPHALRESVPLLIVNDEIAWVCGHRVAEAAAVSSSTWRVLKLHFERCHELASLSASEPRSNSQAFPSNRD